MHFLIFCIYEKDQIYNIQEKVMTLLFPLQVHGIFRRSRTGNSVDESRMVLNFERIQTLIYFIVIRQV